MEERTSLDECSVWCPNICTDGKEVDRAQLAHCIYDMCLVGDMMSNQGLEKSKPTLFISFLHGDLIAVQRRTGFDIRIESNKNAKEESFVVVGRGCR